ncbi:hypothetical protein [Peptoniphilus indolicus]|uniref:Transcription regulator n=2 Tax=Peptoniphilus indolicus TaxID=33030 RepID=G4D1K3_9FIRM|nr:hypothetical protein [Peptoniphilus indolicus]EGY80652.1 transcription regulator [Peptoniphilus indolicus ATCC 29427]SUB74973.1 Uncharacterised protein [Peptoniphilus indolicus]
MCIKFIHKIIFSGISVAILAISDNSLGLHMYVQYKIDYIILFLVFFGISSLINDISKIVEYKINANSNTQLNKKY